tara:strand:+ start:369 stop:722 length:354 start_codon:yes stop_codon:yes gene_type:complete
MEDNKLIAEFMGGVMHEGLMSLPDDNNLYNIECQLHYHTSWDWLMPVVEKIESLGYIVEIVTHKTEISKKEEYPNKSKMMMYPGKKINSTYQAVVEFIKEYNRTTDYNKVTYYDGQG